MAGWLSFTILQHYRVLNKVCWKVDIIPWIFNLTDVCPYTRNFWWACQFGNNALFIINIVEDRAIKITFEEQPEKNQFYKKKKKYMR